MSLFLLGSCSKLTSSIVKHIAAQNIYRKIIIGDLLPSYSLFKRFYSLKQQLEGVNTNTSVDILKICSLESVNENIAEASDVLFITHDYSKNVISKTALVKEVAEDAKHSEGKTILYVAPAEYDSYFFKDPYREYLNGETVLKRKLPNVNIIRTDIVENGQYHQYYNQNVQQRIRNYSKDMKLVRQKVFLDEILNILTKKPNGQSVLLRGDTPVAELPLTHRSEQVLDFSEKLFDTWGMKSNMKQLSQMNPQYLHTLITAGFAPQMNK